MIFGRPSRNWRMPAVMIEVPPPPPMPMMPAMSSRAARKLEKAMPIASTALPRSSQASDGSNALRMAGRNRLGIYIDGGRRLACADIDAHNAPARRLDASGQIGKLLALRVGRADDVDPLHFSSATG